jgi:hypothetical protein
VAHNNSTSRQQIIDHSLAERKTEKEPDGVADHLGRKTVAMIERISELAHLAGIAGKSDRDVNVTVPSDKLLPRDMVFRDPENGCEIGANLIMRIASIIGRLGRLH